jgi:gamma-glutamyltranspeptidase/glutathione hydrolase
MAYPTFGKPPAGSGTAAGLDALFTPIRGAAERPQFPEAYEPEYDTTSFSIVDHFGNTGLLLNNGIRLGSTSPYPDNVNYVRGGQIPLLNNSPTIVLKGGKVAMVFGTPGGETIGQTEFQMLVNVLDFPPAGAALRARRDAALYKPGAEIHVTIEKRVPQSALKALEEWGHKVAPTSDSPRKSAACRPSSSISRREP